MKQLGDKELLNAILNEHKLAASSMTTLVLESADQNLRNDATKILQNTFKHQKQIFDIMTQKGWYQTEVASSQEIDRVKTELSSQGQFQF
jgi:spore coat protein CotF